MNPSDFTVLLVDDSEVNQELWQAILEAEGYTVRSARRGEEALSKVARETLDLVILDVVMPGISGFEVLEQLRTEYSPEALPVIMATSKDHKDDVVRAFGLGANDYVTKPLDREVTLARIAAQLRHRQARRPGAPDPTTTAVDVRRTGGEGVPGDDVIGRVIDDKYRVEALIGHGNFGAVFRATHLSLQRPVALKLLRNSVGADSTSLARFRQEGVSLSRLQHPNVVSVLDFSASEKLTYLVMEFLDGRSLDDELSAEGRLGLQRTRAIALPICDVLAEAHELGIIHRDIKPQNIFLHRSRHGEAVKVLDFGIAKLVGDADIEQRLTIEGNSVGTPAYMAPERFTEASYGGASDVYSLGVMLYEMLVGQTPFAEAGNSFFKLIRLHVAVPPRPLRDRDPDLPAAVDRLVLAALEKRPENRPTPSQLAAGLREVAA